MKRVQRPRTVIAFALVALLGAAATSCSEDTADVAPTTVAATPAPATTTTTAPTTTLGPYVSPLGDIVGEALYAGAFGILAGLLVRADLVQAIRAEGPFTVFAPTDDAFATVPAETLDAVMADPDLLTAVLTYHVVAGKVPASKVVAADGTEIKTVEGQKIAVSVKGGKVYLNGTTKVTKTDIPASNGVIHQINGVLLPPVMD